MDRERHKQPTFVFQSPQRPLRVFRCWGLGSTLGVASGPHHDRPVPRWASPILQKGPESMARDLGIDPTHTMSTETLLTTTRMKILEKNADHANNDKNENNAALISELMKAWEICLREPSLRKDRPSEKPAGDRAQSRVPTSELLLDEALSIQVQFLIWAGRM